MGLGPIARWKKASLPELAVRLRWAFAVSVVTALLLPFVMGQWKPCVSFGLLLAFWVVASIVEVSSSRAKQRQAGRFESWLRKRAAITACMWPISVSRFSSLG